MDESGSTSGSWADVELIICPLYVDIVYLPLVDVLISSWSPPSVVH
jgi:hypothetical protein